MKPNKRVLVFQVALPTYRIDFFDKIASGLSEGFKVYYSDGKLGILTEGRATYGWAVRLGAVRSFLGVFEWQSGVLSTPIEKGDVVVVSGGPRCITNLLLLIVARLKGAKTVWWGQYWSHTSKQHLFLIRMLLMRLSNAVLMYTDQEVGEYKAGIGKSDRRLVSALNNGINVDPVISVRSPYHSRLRRNSALFIGRLTEKSSLDVVLKAMTDDRLKELTLDIIGDGDAKAGLLALVESLGLKQRVIWHGAIIDESKIAGVANTCRYFVYPGAVGLSLIHAMAYGLPALIHGERRLQGPEIAAFDDGVTGVSFSVGDQGSMADKFDSLAGKYDLLDSMSAEAKRRADEMYNTHSMARRFLEMVRQMTH